MIATKTKDHYNIISTFGRVFTSGFSGRLASENENRVETVLHNIADWTSDNKMVLNASKTESLLVTGKRLEKKAPDTNPKLSCNGSAIEQITSQKLLEFY